MIKNIRHTGIVTDNLEKSQLFYCEMLDFKIDNHQIETGHYIATMLGLKNVKVETIKMSLYDKQKIELLYFHSHPKEKKTVSINSIGITHIALTVENINQIYEKFISEKIVFINPPQITNNNYAKVAFCRSPEGIFLELVELL